VQNLLLGLGVVLLAVAAVIFVMVSWGRMGIGGRAAVAAVITILSGTAVAAAYRRGLRATAEALATLTVVLVLLDIFAVRRTELGALDGISASHYWAAALALVAVAAGLGAAVMPLHSLRLIAAVSGQFPLTILTVDVALKVERPAVAVAVGFGLQTLALISAIRLLDNRPQVADAQLLLALSVPGAWLIGFFSGLAAGYLENEFRPDGVAVLLGLAAVAALAASVLTRWKPGRHISAGAVMAAGLFAVWVPGPVYLPESWWSVAFAGLALVALTPLLVFPVWARMAPAGVCAFFTMLMTLSGLIWTVTIVVAPLSWIFTPWSAVGDTSAVSLLEPILQREVPLWAPASLGIAAAFALLAPRILGQPSLRSSAARTSFITVAIGFVMAALVTLPLSVGLSYRGALGWDFVLGAVLLCTGLRMMRRGGRLAPLPVAVGSLAGASVLGMTLVWSLASASATVVVWAAAFGVAALAAWLAPLSLRPLLVALTVILGWAEAGLLAQRTLGSVPASGLAVAAVAAATLASALLARHPGRVIHAVQAASALGYALGVELAFSEAGPLALALAVGVVVAMVGLAGAPWQQRPAWSALTAGLLCAQAVAVARWIGVDLAPGGLVLATTAAAIWLAVLWTPRRWIARPFAVELVGISGYVIGTMVTAGEADQLWLALLTGGVAAAVGATAPTRRFAGYPATGLLLGSSWVRLALADVTTPEAYTVPSGLVLLGWGYLRRRRNPQLGSWSAYGPGLALVLLPSLVRTLTDTGLVWPALLGLTALTVLILGAAYRLQSPLVLGGLTLGVEAVVQLAPYLAMVYDAVPRWVSLAVVGLVLLGIGATYEHRLRDVRQLWRGLRQMR